MFSNGGGHHARFRREDVSGHRLAPGIVPRALGFARPYVKWIAAFLAATVAGSFLAIVPPLLFKRLIDHSIPARDHASLVAVTVLGVLVALGIATLSLAARWYSSRVGEGLIFDLRVALFDHVQRMPFAFFTRSQTGALISRLNNDVVGAQQAITTTLGNIVSNTILVVAVLGSMMVLDWRLTLLALAVLPLFLLPARRLGRRLQRLTHEQMQQNAAMNTLMQERFNVAGALVVKLFGRPAGERDSFSARAAKLRDTGTRLAVLMRFFFVLLALVAAGGTAIVYYVGGRMVFAGELSVGAIVAFAAYVSQLYQPLTQLTNARVDFMTAFVSFERVFEVLDLPHGITDASGARALSRPDGRVELDHVWFRYPGSEVSLSSLEEGLPAEANGEAEPVLRDVTLAVEPGRTVALVGPSGGGKTTIAMLVARLYDVTSGAVRIDGHDVRELTQETLRSGIGVVPQDPHLFHDTIANNLRYARPGATDEQLVEACRAAQIHELIASLPDGYGTVVGERGYRLSGGEKQRLALARVFLRDPAIVILDEATSHLDSDSEASIREALARVLEARTSIVIAHRLSTIVDADEIFVVDGGRIVERGRHHELLASGGLYAELFETQVSGAAAEAI